MNIIKIYKQIFFLTLLNILFAKDFGKNIVQYKNFEWYYVQTEHFDIYVSDSTGYHLNFLKKTSEDAYDKIQSLMNWKMKDRVSIIIYSSHNDFQQTNVIGMHMPEGVGGVTELLKNRVVIPFDGSYREFKHVIYHELVHAFINDCVYGGNLKNMIAGQIKVRIPLWMNEGLAEYIAHKWDTNSDMWIRDMVINGNQLPHINQLNGYWAYRGGQSVWNFITEKWGEESIAEIIRQIKRKGTISKGLQASISIDIEGLNEQWHKYLKQQYWKEIDNDHIEDISTRLTDHQKIKNHYNIAPSISPNGNEVALFSDKDGIMRLLIINSLDGKVIKEVIQGGRSSQFEELHILKPGITWSPYGNRLAVAVKSGKSDALVIINLDNDKKNIKRFDSLEGIFRPTWNPKNNLIAFIGNNGFASDIYIYDIDNDTLTNLTNDWFTDDHVSWDENGENLLFVSNRGDYLNPIDSKEPSDDDIFIYRINLEQYDIYQMNFQNQSMQRLTETDYDESYPFYSNKNNILGYISDKNGINNIYLKPDSEEQATPITNISTGITQLSWNMSTNQLIFTGFNNSGYDIFTMYNPINRITDNKNLVNANWKNKILDNQPLLKSKKEIDDSSSILNDKYKNFVFLDIDRFNNSTNQDSIFNKTINKNHDRMDASNTLKMFKYKTRYTLDYADVNYSYSSQAGSSGLVNIVFSDILGDYKIIINTEMEIRLKSSDYLLTYYNLSNKIDWKVRLYHFGQELYDWQVVEYNNGAYGEEYLPTIRYQTLGMNLEPSFPISRFQRLDFGLDFSEYSKQYLTWTTLYDYTEENDEDYKKRFFMPFLQYNYDNTLWQETYPVKGKRIYLKYMNSLLNKNLQSPSFYALTFDMRAYASMNNKLSTAIRLFGGQLGGPDVNRATFRVGGTTYLPFFNDKQQQSQYELYYDIHSSENQIYYNQYVMPIRGVPVGAKFGKNVLVMNTEFRLPFLMYYFPAIGFLGKINSVFFSDLGVVWNDNFPNISNSDSWDEDLDTINGYSLYQNYQESNNADDLIRVTQPEGWIWTFGFGPRFILLGMPWQIDFAWQYNPITNELSSRRWYVSIGLDF